MAPLHFQEEKAEREGREAKSRPKLEVCATQSEVQRFLLGGEGILKLCIFGLQRLKNPWIFGFLAVVVDR